MSYPVHTNISIALKNFLPMFCILLMALFHILLQKYYPIRLRCGPKHPLGKLWETVLCFFYTSVLINCLIWCSTLIILSGNVEISSGPKSYFGQCFSICHWNLNSITAYNHAKVSLLITYNLLHKFDIICLSETYLNTETPPKDANLEIPGYNMFRSDHPPNYKKGGVCVYYKATIPLRILNVNPLVPDVH